MIHVSAKPRVLNQRNPKGITPLGFEVQELRDVRL